MKRILKWLRLWLCNEGYHPFSETEITTWVSINDDTLHCRVYCRSCGFVFSRSKWQATDF